MAKTHPTTVFLYADGHAVARFEEKHPAAGRVEWVEVWERFGPTCRFPGYGTYHDDGTGTGNRVASPGRGRLIISRRSAWELASKCAVIRVTAPDESHGSQKTQALGLAVGHVSLQLAGHDSWDAMSVPLLDVLSGDFHYQPEYNETFDPDVVRWSDHRVARVVRDPKRAKEVPAHV